MLSLNTCLREFATPTPTCPPTASLTEALSLLQRFTAGASTESFPDQMVLLNEEQSCVGVVRTCRLLPYLLPGGSGSSPDASLSEAIMPPSHVSDLPTILEPLTTLSGNLSVNQFLPYLQPASGPQSLPHYALMGEDGRFLGLLDRLQLLHTVVAHLPEWGHLFSHVVAPTTAFTLPTLSSPQQHTVQLVQQLLAQKVDLETQLKSHQAAAHHLNITQVTAGGNTPAGITAPLAPPPSTSPTPIHLVNSLLQLLEQLPLPLMLQTQDGIVVMQNSVWCEQVGKWLDPNWLRQEAAPWLEATTTSSGLKASGLPDDTTTSPSSGATCQLGPKPDTCICVCPLKNGQEQVLQFVKIPIGQLPLEAGASGWEVPLQGKEAVSTAPPLAIAESATESVSSFRLATLSPTATEAPCPLAGMAQATTTVPVIAGATLWLILAQDMTEQQQLSRELAAKNADLVQLNRLKDEFLACISHELRTPLTAVLGLSSLLKDQTIGEMNQRQMHYAQLIYQSGRHLMAVVNDILDLARMETGQLELSPEPVDIPTVCSRAFDQAKQLRLLDDKHPSSDAVCQFPQFSLVIEPDLKFLIADEQRLRQMLVHLLSNALKFTTSDQQIGLRVNRWGGWIAFTVWDQGIGIAADKQHLIFQKFQQLENPLTRRFEGTGLGLVLTQRLARLHGGDVTFTSKEGEGSQFTILLPPDPPEKTALANREETDPFAANYPAGRVPLSTPQPPSAPQVTSVTSAISRNNRLVLIVEAVVPFIDSLSEQLSGLGYRVVIARSGTEALEKARRLQPCIIFLNPVLPLLSGWDVLTLLKSNQETRLIPVVVTATTADDAQAQRNYADGWLTLPLQAKALRQTLQHLVWEEPTPTTPFKASPVLTVLHLRPEATVNERAIPSSDLTQLLHSHHYRVLEAEDLEQAELLARVWKPNVVLLDGSLNDPCTYFQHFSQHTFLASLPLITLEQETTQAANQIMGLLVFPCLSTATATIPTVMSDGESSALLQVIEIAAGYAWRPAILALDLARLPQSLEDTEPPAATITSRDGFPQETEWLQALVQYLQTAGLRGLVGRSRQEVLQQVQSQSVDLLVICWTEVELPATTLAWLSELQQMNPKPPILVLDHRSYGATELHTSAAKLPTLLQELAAQILSPALPMAELLNTVHQLLKERGDRG